MLSTDQTLNKGRYRIINLFSHDDTGGMYEAYDTVNNSNVVLKECVNALGNLATTDQIQALDASFAASAKVLTSIKHDSLVSVQDYFSEIGCQYLVLEGVTGLDLTKYLDPDEPRPTLSEVMAWTNKVLAGLHHLHRLSPPLIHRDIRPKNIKLTSGSAVKLLTAGIGMEPTVGNVPQISVRSNGKNARNYRPLEQLFAEADPGAREAVLKGLDEKAQKLLTAPLDVRCDLYAVGASIYHILTGTLPPDAMSRALAIQQGKPDPLQAPAVIDENIPIEISDAFMKSMSITREDRFDSAVIMNQVLRTAVVRTQERTAEGAEVPIQLKKISRSAAVKQAPVPEAPVFKTPVIEAPAEISIREEIAPPAPKAAPKAEVVSPEELLELEKKKTEELEAERIRLEEEHQRIEARRLELEAERERLAAEKARLELEAKQERERQEKERLEKEAEEERQRAAQKMAELEAERQKRQEEEKRLEKLAEEEKKKAEERLKALRSEHERIREERRRIEAAEKEELERTEKRLLELSFQPNRPSGELPGQDPEDQLLEVHTSDPSVKTTQEIIELLGEEPLANDTEKTKRASSHRTQVYDEYDDFELHKESRSGLPLPMIAAAAAIILVVAVGAWMFLSGGSTPEPTAAVPQELSPTVDQPVIDPQQPTDPSVIATGDISNSGDSSVTLPSDSGSTTTDQRSAFAQEQERKARQAKLDAAKKAAPAPAKTPKKVTVDDLINDN
jgi:serine/threonine protein kinase